MKKIFLLLLLIQIFILCATKTQAQTLPVGSCGIVYTYDASGNRTKREYVCNNGLVAGNQPDAESAKISTDDIIKVDVLYPNPTTGVFSIRLFKTLDKADITISNAEGGIILKRKESGNQLVYDLSRYPSGEYLVTIRQGQNVINMKVIKGK